MTDLEWLWILAQIVALLVLTGGVVVLLLCAVIYAHAFWNFLGTNPDEPINSKTYREAHRS